MVVSLAKPPINIFLQIMGRGKLLEPNLRTLLSSNLNNQKVKIK